MAVAGDGADDRLVHGCRQREKGQKAAIIARLGLLYVDLKKKKKGRTFLRRLLAHVHVLPFNVAGYWEVLGEKVGELFILAVRRMAVEEQNIAIKHRRIKDENKNES